MQQKDKFLEAAAKKMPLLINELKKLYPDAECSLNYETPFQLLISTQLSAQCTDARVNMVTPALFARFPDAKSFAEGDVSEIEIPIKEDIDKVINNEFINDTDTLESDVLLKENNEVKYDKRDDIVVNKKEVAETVDINKDDKVENTSIFNINEDSETYGTLLVYIVRENETINSIITKYNTTIEELEKYNDLKDLSIGTKLIIPLVNE